MRDAFRWLSLGVLAIALCGCDRTPSDRLQGYVEGEFVYVASPLAGALQTLSVQRGQEVKAGDALFALENVSEKAAVAQAESRLALAKANLADIRKGRRPSEIQSLEAQLQQARVRSELSQKDLERIQSSAKEGGISQQELDRATALAQENVQRIAQLQADLTTAKLGGREDQLSAMEADVKAQEASLKKAQWDLDQKSQTCTQAGKVFDTLYRDGEWVAAGRPVVVVLPPGNLKVRAFVPEEKLGALKTGETLRVQIDGQNTILNGKVSFISPKAEYTPPVIYSRETRQKLVFLIELRFEPSDAINLHPGQPVDVLWGK